MLRICQLLNGKPRQPGTLFLVLASVFMACPSFSVATTPLDPDPTGHWKGEIEIPSGAMKIDVDFAKKDGAWKADISIPAQGAVDVPLINVSIDGRKIAFDMSGVPGDPKFRGELSTDGQEITGDFTQGGATIPFTLKRGENRAEAAREALEGFKEFVEKAIEDWMVPGIAIGIVVEDEVVFAEGFGLRNLEEKLPMTSRTLLAIGSSGKAFTTFALGTLVDEGKLDWDKPVVTYMPEFKLYDEYASSHITARDLVTHRSGLPRHDLVWYNSSASREELVRRLRFLKPNKDLRESWQYNNLMFMTAGVLAGKINGTSWEETIRTRVFTPLDMKYSNLSVIDSQTTSDFAMPYQEKDDEIEKMSFRNIDVVGPAGSINSNIEDMTKWLRVHLAKGEFGGKRVLDEATLLEMHTPQMVIPGLPTKPENSPSSYAMGWMTNTYQGHYRSAHGGNIDGFSALVTLFPHDRLGIVAIANKNATPLPGLVTRHAADLILELEENDWNAKALKKMATAKKEQKTAEEKKAEERKTGTHPAHTLDEYAGDYEHPGYGVLKVERTDDGLAMTFNDIRTPMEHWHFEVFNGLENPDDRAFEDSKIRFLTNMKGEVYALAAPFELLVDEIIFTRKPDVRMEDPEYLARFLGKYKLANQVVTVGLKGNTLTLTVPGQPQYDLMPSRDDEFNLKGLSGFSVRFVKNDDGTMIARFNQPNGIFDAKRKGN